jgi:hypothetical protein
MLRRFAAAAVVLFLVVGIIIAAEVKGTISKVEEGKGGKGGAKVTLKVGDKEEVLRIGKMTKITGADGKEIEAKDAATALHEGDQVTATTDEIEKNGKKITITKELKVTKAKK